MSDLNKIMIIGRFTGDPIKKSTPNGTSVSSFSIANNRTFVQNGEKKEQVGFFNCVAWGKQADTISEYCKKGHRIGIEGRLTQRSWEKDGQKHSTVEIFVDNFQFLSQPEKQKEEKKEKVNVENPFDGEYIPF